MDNSLKTKEKPPKRGANAPAKGKTKNFLIGKEVKTKDLRHSAAERPSGPTTKPRIAAAEGRVKPLVRLLRCAMALRVTVPLGCGSRRLVWPKGSLPARQTRPECPFSLINSHPFGSARSRPRREAAQRTLDGEDRSGTIRDEGKRIQERGGRAGRGSPRRACADARGDTLLVELRALLHIHPPPQNSKRLHLRFHLGRADHPERVK